jgi:hypothetical protein
VVTTFVSTASEHGDAGCQSGYHRVATMRAADCDGSFDEFDV